MIAIAFRVAFFGRCRNKKKMIIKYDFKKRTPRLVLGSEHLDPVIGEITEEELPKNSQGFLPSVNFKFGELGD